MLKFLTLSASLWLTATTLAHSANVIGFKEADLDEAGSRPLHIAMWYPAETQTKTVSVGDNGVFHGAEANADARPLSGPHSLVLLSHGHGGNWRNLSWLAAQLAGEGYIVAAPDHPGTTTFSNDPAQAAKLWERPHDLSRVIDALIAEPELAGEVDEKHIAAIGHSLGGWTVSALAGASFDTGQLDRECQANSIPRACSLVQELGLANPELEKEMGDPRVKAFVSLDLGGARGFTPDSLAAIHAPFLVISAGTDVGDMPARLESGYLAEHLPSATSTYIDIPDAMHFSFLQVCKAGGDALLEAENPGDGILCKDGGTRSREDIHREIAGYVTGFLATAMPLRQ